MSVRAESSSPAGVEAAGDLGRGLLHNLGRVILGKDEPLRLAVVALLSGGHLLIEDMPGVGKTLLAKTLARSIGGTFERVQGTPDVLPAEITGTNVFHPDTGRWSFRPGPLFANVVLVDEVNRATPRTQSALLEAMEEGQVTVDGDTHPLPRPLFLVATENPFEHVGTFPLVEGQLDRFAVVIRLGHPPRQAERALLLGTGGTEALEDIRPVAEPASLEAAIAAVHGLHCAPAVADYVVDIADATRAHPDVVLGASARASLSLLRAAKAHAVMADRHFVTPDDVKAVARAALAHRLAIAGSVDIEAGSQVVDSVLASVPPPR